MAARVDYKCKRFIKLASGRRRAARTEQRIRFNERKYTYARVLYIMVHFFVIPRKATTLNI